MAFLTKFAKMANRTKSFVTCAIHRTASNPEEFTMKLNAFFKKQEEEQFIVPVFKKSLLYPDQKAIRDSTGEYTYLHIYKGARKLAAQVSNICGSGTSACVAYIYTNSVLAPVTMWSCWMSGQVLLPINSTYPYEALKTLIENAKPTLIISTSEHEATLKKLAADLDAAVLVLDHSFLHSKDILLPDVNKMVFTAGHSVFIEGALNEYFYTNSNALYLYTSGTTGHPKGVVLSHGNVDTQAKQCANMWQLNMCDNVLHVNLEPHMSVCICTIMSVLRAGAKLIMQDHFCSASAWAMMLGVSSTEKEKVNIFVAHPSTYNLLIKEFDKTFSKKPKVVDFIKRFMKKHFRKMISTAAPISPVDAQRWLEITGHPLIDTYGTTEVGIILEASSIQTEPAHQEITPKMTAQEQSEVLVRVASSDKEPIPHGKSSPMTEQAESDVPIHVVSHDQEILLQKIPSTTIEQAQSDVPIHVVSHDQEILPQEISSTTTEQAESDVPVHVVNHDKEILPQEISSTTTEQAESDVPVHVVNHDKEILPQEISSTTTEQAESDVPIHVVRHDQEILPQEISSTTIEKAQSDVPVDVMSHVKEILPQEIPSTMTEQAESTVQARVVSNDKKPVPDENTSTIAEQAQGTIQVRLVSSDKNVLMTMDAGGVVKVDPDKMVAGELHVAGPTVFKKYLNDEDTYPEHFDGEFFKTGDVFSCANGTLKFQERLANDIINTGAHTVSSAEIESQLVKHPSIQKVVVLGIPDPIGGERICAICMLHLNTQLDLNALKEFCSNVLPTYMHPSLLKIVPGLPANIDKKALAEKVLKSEL